MKGLFFVRSADPSYDARLKKYIVIAESLNWGVEVVAWPRTGVVAGRFMFDKVAPHGARFSNLWNLICWNVFVIKVLVRHRKEINVIHAIDFDCVIPSLLFATFFRKKIVYDIYDKYTDSRGVGDSLVGRVVDVVDRVVARTCDHVLVADKSRLGQHDFLRGTTVHVVENVPADYSFLRTCEYSTVNSDSDCVQRVLKIGYVGALELHHRGLEDLLNVVVSNEYQVELHIAGVGPLESECVKSGEMSSSVVFYGAVQHEKGMRLLQECDIVYGQYYKSIKNHLFAAPNKYYEHLMLGMPLLTTTGTPPGVKVSVEGTGWAVSEGEAALRDFFDMQCRKRLLSDAREFSVNARKLWESKYQNYNRDLHDRYSEWLG